MAATAQTPDLTATASIFVSTSLDNMKAFFGKTAEEAARLDLVGANRRLVDTVIDQTKHTAARAFDAARQRDLLGVAQHLANGTLEGAKQTVSVVAAEAKRLDPVGSGARMAQESLELTRRQIDLSLETSRRLTDSVSALLPFKLHVGAGDLAVTNRAGRAVTRVEIDVDAARPQASKPEGSLAGRAKPEPKREKAEPASAKA